MNIQINVWGGHKVNNYTMRKEPSDKVKQGYTPKKIMTKLFANMILGGYSF